MTHHDRNETLWMNTVERLVDNLNEALGEVCDEIARGGGAPGVVAVVGEFIDNLELHDHPVFQRWLDAKDALDAD